MMCIVFYSFSLINATPLLENVNEGRIRDFENMVIWEYEVGEWRVFVFALIFQLPKKLSHQLDKLGSFLALGFCRIPQLLTHLVLNQGVSNQEVVSSIPITCIMSLLII